MSVLKPTPGPWHNNSADETTVIGPGNRDICVMLGDYETDDAYEMAANARLIAASPDLYDALSQLMREVDEMARRVGWAGNGGREMARAALAKVPQ